MTIQIYYAYKNMAPAYGNKSVDGVIMYIMMWNQKVKNIISFITKTLPFNIFLQINTWLLLNY